MGEVVGELEALGPQPVPPRQGDPGRGATSAGAPGRRRPAGCWAAGPSGAAGDGPRRGAAGRCRVAAARAASPDGIGGCGRHKTEMCSTFRRSRSTHVQGEVRMAESEALHAEHRLEYPYSRSVGPVIGAFLTGLRDGRLSGCQRVRRLGHRAAHRVRPHHRRGRRRAGRGRPRRGGRVVGVGRPPAAQAPAPTPFAWALIRLDGADTALLHAVDAGGPDASPPATGSPSGSDRRPTASAPWPTSRPSCPREGVLMADETTTDDGGRDR